MTEFAIGDYVVYRDWLGYLLYGHTTSHVNGQIVGLTTDRKYVQIETFWTVNGEEDGVDQRWVRASRVRLVSHAKEKSRALALPANIMDEVKSLRDAVGNDNAVIELLRDVRKVYKAT